TGPIVAEGLDFFAPYGPEVETPRLNVVVMVVILVVMGYFWPREAKIRHSVEETYPAGILPYLKANPLQGNVLNFYLWGGYLGWHDPDMKDFVDSRVDIFEYAGVLQDYLTLLGADTIQHRPDSVLEKYKIKYVLFPPADSKNKLLAAGDLVYVLEHESRWKVLYKD